MKILLLLYFPRSGSTFFASLVARYFSNVLVIPELRLPLLLISHEAPPGKSQKEFLIELVKQDYQFPATGLSEPDVERSIDQMNGYSVENFLTALARTLAEKNNMKPDLVLYKCGAVVHWWPVLRDKMPGTRFVHVYRDGRAAVCSAINTERPYRVGQMMGRGDPWVQSNRWCEYMVKLRKFRSQCESLVEIRYESLCRNPDQVLSTFARSLGLQAREEYGAGLEVASKEQSIHRHVNQEALPDRVEGWKTELKTWQAVVCESRCKEELRRLEYEPYFLLRHGFLVRLGYLVSGYAFHVYTSLKFYLDVLKQGASNPQALAKMIRLHLRSRNLRG